MSKIQKSKRKQYCNIDARTSTHDIFAILDSVDSENEEDIENLMNDSDTEFVVVDEEEEAEEIMLEGNVTQEEGSILIPEANVHILTHSQDIDFHSNSDDGVQIIGYVKNESPVVLEENAGDAEEVQLTGSSETQAEEAIFIPVENDHDLQHVSDVHQREDPAKMRGTKNKKEPKKKPALNRNKPVDKKQPGKKKQPAKTKQLVEKK